MPWVGFVKPVYIMDTTIGRVVIYKTTEADQQRMRLTPNCNVAKELPALTVAVHSDECVNLKVIADGELDIWVTSVIKGDKPGNWDFPETVKEDVPVNTEKKK